MDAKVLRPLGGLIISIRRAQLNLETYVKRFSLFSTFSLSLFFIKEILMVLGACLVDIQDLASQKLDKNIAIDLASQIWEFDKFW